MSVVTNGEKLLAGDGDLVRCIAGDGDLFGVVPRDGDLLRSFGDSDRDFTNFPIVLGLCRSVTEGDS